jgi:ATP-dependent RNA helicase DDX51/DBP6
VLPTRDLVAQVRETFEALAKGTGLKIGTATGQHSFAHEQAQLVGGSVKGAGSGSGSGSGSGLGSASKKCDLNDGGGGGGTSKVDILICTPGRLIDHLAGTPGFSLQHLRFLVVDEADRLLAQSFQDWLAQVLRAVRPPQADKRNGMTGEDGYVDGEDDHELEGAEDADSLDNEAGKEDADMHPPSPSPSADDTYPPVHIPTHDALAPAWTSLGVPTDLDEHRHSSCQKLLFSATLTADPAQLSALGLREPKYFVVSGAGAGAGTSEAQTSVAEDKDEEGDTILGDTDATEAAGPLATTEDAVPDKELALAHALEGVALSRFSMPAGLREHYAVASGTQKPLVLFWLLRARGLNRQRVLVFTKSAESTARLVRLLELLGQSVPAVNEPETAIETESKIETTGAVSTSVKAYSSDLPPTERRAVLEGFKRGTIGVLVCSDLISRGLDVPDVGAVVSYDVPVDMRKYVHRAGRTARAGKEGECWVLVEEQEVSEAIFRG